MPVERRAFDLETRALYSLYALTRRFGDVRSLGPYPDTEGLSAAEALEILAAEAPTSPSRAARRLDAVARYRYASARDEELDILETSLYEASLQRLTTEEGGVELLAQIIESRAAVDGESEDVPVGEFLEAVVGEALDQGVIAPWLATVTTALCQGVLVDAVLPGGDNEKVARLTTCFCVPQDQAPALADFDKFIDPRNWPDCHGFWCDVKVHGDVGSVHDPFLGTDATKMSIIETVGICDRDDEAWEIKVCLDVVITKDVGSGTRPDKLTMTYDLCRDDQGNVIKNDSVDVDRGVIEVTFDNGQVCVKSTKDIHFTGLWEGQSTVDSACATGYGDAAIDMVFGCADELPPADTEISLCQ